MKPNNRSGKTYSKPSIATTGDSEVAPRVSLGTPNGRNSSGLQFSLERLDTTNRMQIRAGMWGYLSKYLGHSTDACLLLLFLQGFHLFGFDLNERLLWAAL